MSTRLRIAAAAAAALTLAAAASAGAAKPDPPFKHYDVEFVADVSYRQVRETDDADHTEIVTAGFHLRGEEDKVQVLRGQLYGPWPIRGTVVTDATASRVSTTAGGTNEACRGEGVDSFGRGSLVPGRPPFGWPADAIAFAPFLPMTCTDTDGGSGTARVVLVTAAPRSATRVPSRFHVRLDLGDGAVAKGGKGLRWELRRVVSGKRDCPGADYYTRVCTTSVTGWLRFTPAKPPKASRGRPLSARGTR
jgi:hypothetical protein